jgi:hypothetical protein
MLLLATYVSSHAALRAEKALKVAGISVELIPVPRQVQSLCGFGLLAEVPDGALLQESGAENLWQVREPEAGRWRRTYEPYP